MLYMCIGVSTAADALELTSCGLWCAHRHHRCCGHGLSDCTGLLDAILADAG